MSQKHSSERFGTTSPVTTSSRCNYIHRISYTILILRYAEYRMFKDISGLAESNLEPVVKVPARMYLARHVYTTCIFTVAGDDLVEARLSCGRNISTPALA